MKVGDAHHAPSDDPDVLLMLEFQRGNEEAFVTLYRRHRDRIVNVTRRLMGNPVDGEEAAQEVFLKLYQARARYTPQSRFLTFLFRIATNHCFNVRARHETKKRDAGARVEHAAAPAHNQPETMTQQSEMRAALQKALAALPEKQSAAVVLCHYEGLSCQAAGEILELSEGAVKQLLHRARERLQQSLAAYAPQGATHAVR